jgi:acetyltransferase-like isoleucine patch superfamily enzyme
MGARGFLSELRLYFCNEWVGKIPSHRIRLWFYRRVMKFDSKQQSCILMHCTFDAAKGLTVGKDSVINSRCRLDTRGGITIGNKVSISQEVIILTADHDVESTDFAGRNRQVVIEDFVWIGTRAIILPGVVVGRGAVVAAGAVVSKNVEPFTVVAGVPAQFIKKRRRDINYIVNYHRLFQ